MPQNKQLNIRLSEELHARLLSEKSRTGVPVSEIIRRAVEHYLSQSRKATQ